MSVKRVITLIVLLAMGALLAAGVAVLFDLRFEGGDNYPPYSTLRADPLGARALFDSLQALPELEVARNLRPLCELKEGTGTTLFLLGTDANDLRWFSGDEARHLEEFMIDGGRVVLTLAPKARDPFRNASTRFAAPTSSTLSTKATSSTLTASPAKCTSSTLAEAAPRQNDAPTSLPAVYPPPRSLRKAESEEAELRKREEEEKGRRAQAAPT